MATVMNKMMILSKEGTFKVIINRKWGGKKKN
jgi:hypothetical protein